MRCSRVLCGIKGIFPIIKKECPEAVHYLDRYAGLSGYRLAIDATLLVQRFHFSEDEHPARHVIGFYRLISALRAADVYPIFVFDHLSSRLTAKSRETEKRRETRRIVRERMRLEIRRASRLRLLSAELKRIIALPEEDRVRVGQLLKGWQRSDASREEREPAAETLENMLATFDVPETSSSEALKDWTTFRLRLDELVESAGTRIEEEGRETQESPDERTDLDPVPSTEEAIEENADTAWQTIREDQMSSAYAIAAQIDALRQDFLEHHPKAPVREVSSILEQAQDVAGQSQEQHLPPTPSFAAPSSRPTQTPTQLQMNAVEAQLYSSLSDGLDATSASPHDSPAWQLVQQKMQSSIEDAAKDVEEEQPGESAEPGSAVSATTPPRLYEVDQTAFDAITSRNESLQRSYRRSSLPLSPSIFDDCAALCSLVEVPVLWTGSGSPYGGAKGEAEALAASLVAGGYADAVATEDSDVLLAEVPLVRNLTGTKKPMEVIDSLKARRTLFPVSQPPTASEEEESADAIRRADNVSRYSMLELALLCGTDFNRTIPGLAGKGGLRLLRKYGTIRGILRTYPQASKKYSPPDGMSWKEYGVELTRARSVFKTPPDASRALRLNGVTSWDRRERQARRQRRKVTRKSEEEGEAEGRGKVKGKHDDEGEVEGLSRIEAAVDERSPESDSGDLPADADPTYSATPTTSTTPTAPTTPTTLMALEQDIPSEDGSRSLVEAQEEEATSSAIEIPPPPSIGLLESLSRQDDETVARTNPPDTEQPRRYIVPDYDRWAVRAFLRSKGLGKGREIVSSAGWRQREEALQSGFALESDLDEGVAEADAVGEAGVDTPSFGEGVFGDASASVRFEWEGAATSGGSGGSDDAEKPPSRE